MGSRLLSLRQAQTDTLNKKGAIHMNLLISRI